MQRDWFIPLGVGLAILLGACSSSTNSSSSTSPGSNAAASKCNALATKYCNKLAPCQGGSVSDCVSAFNTQLKNSYGSDCSGADQVSSTYDACMSEIDGLACGDAVPADCQSVILFQQ